MTAIPDTNPTSADDAWVRSGRVMRWSPQAADEDRALPASLAWLVAAPGNEAPQ